MLIYIFHMFQILALQMLQKFSVFSFILSNGNTFFGQGEETSLDELERGLATSSMVTRWKDANPELAKTEKDYVRETIRELKKGLGGQETFIKGSGTVILLFKKQS